MSLTQEDFAVVARAVPRMTRATPDQYAWCFSESELTALLNAAREEARLQGVPEGWVGIVRDLADDLEAEVEARRSGEVPRRIERDLEVVKRARAMIASAPVPPGGWNFDMDAAPKRERASDPHTTLLLCWTNQDGERFVGEAYWHPEDPEAGGWWWENTSPGDYCSDPILDRITGQIIAWMPLPSPPIGEGG